MISMQSGQLATQSGQLAVRSACHAVRSACSQVSLQSGQLPKLLRGSSSLPGPPWPFARIMDQTPQKRARAGLAIPRTWSAQQDLLDAAADDGGSHADGSLAKATLDDIIRIKSSQSQLDSLGAEEAAEMGDKAAMEAAMALADTLVEEVTYHITYYFIVYIIYNICIYV
jgi:hypothetical protein